MEVKYSQKMQDAIKHLTDNPSKENTQIFKALEAAIQKVQSNPIHRDFAKYEMNEYKAVDVLSQIRAFFKIYNHEQVLFFVWINIDPKFIHTNSNGADKCPCYNEFKRQLANDEVEQYVTKKEVETSFKFHGALRRDESIFCSLDDKTSFSSASLNLSINENSQYKIEHIQESQYYSTSLPALIEEVCKKADKETIKLYCDIDLRRDNRFIESVSSTLEKNGFEIQLEDSTLKEYLRHPNKTK
ncbi:hypothetical protein [Halobacteriovorax sp. CON-3]|uniref:hypothetical protein n=1 Tax=Halobacteriovorax sp. CON-3 TaxID=3157710 RepID=UPI0037105125